MTILSRPRRPRRAHEWNARAVVTFTVTLAATGNVTLAARMAGKSRKSAYALRDRDPAFATAWAAAARAAQGNKVEEVKDPSVSRPQGDRIARPGAAPGRSQMRRAATSGARSRDSFFAQLARRAAGIAAQPVEK